MTEFRPTQFQVLPVVIKNLLIINVLFFLGQKAFASGNIISMEDVLALHHVKSPFFQPWQMITHMFLHGDLWHLIGNMFALWMFGSILENLWGPKRFLTFYFVCGLGAAVLHLAFLVYDFNPILADYQAVIKNANTASINAFLVEHVPQNVRAFNEAGGQQVLETLKSPVLSAREIDMMSDFITRFTNEVISTPTLGASGAVFGVLAAFIYLFPNTYIYLYFFVPVKAKWLGLVYFGYEIYMALQNSAGDNIARWAHIGGALVGFLLVLTWNKKNRRKFY